MSTRYGGQGAALVWLALNFGYVVFMLRIMHRRLLPGELRSWFAVDVGKPLVAVVTVVGFWKLGMGTPAAYGAILLNLAAVSFFAAVAAAMAAPQIRASIGHLLLHRRSEHTES
jgi:hypothetical protein